MHVGANVQSAYRERDMTFIVVSIKVSLELVEFFKPIEALGTTVLVEPWEPRYCDALARKVSRQREL